MFTYHRGYGFIDFDNTICRSLHHVKLLLEAMCVKYEPEKVRDYSEPWKPMNLDEKLIRKDREACLRVLQRALDVDEVPKRLSDYDKKQLWWSAMLRVAHSLLGDPMNVTPYEGAREALYELLKMGYAIVYVSSRPAHQSNFGIVRWLRVWKFPLGPVYIADSPVGKLQVAAALRAVPGESFVVDDHPKVQELFCREGFRVFSLKHPWLKRSRVAELFESWDELPRLVRK